MRPKILAFLFAVVTGATLLSAQTLAFTANGLGERQPFAGSLGLFFNLSGSLTVASVGYWDDNLDGVGSLDGVQLTLRVAIFDRNTQAVVTGTQYNFFGMDGVLVGRRLEIQPQDPHHPPFPDRPGQFRMANLTSPITLPAGQYALVAWGFSESNRMLNGATTGTGAAVDMNTFGGVMSFVESRWDDDLGVLPRTLDGSSFRFSPLYASATFSTSAVPEPAAFAGMLGAAALGIAWWRRRVRPRRSSAPAGA